MTGSRAQNLLSCCGCRSHGCSTHHGFLLSRTLQRGGLQISDGECSPKTHSARRDSRSVQPRGRGSELTGGCRSKPDSPSGHNGASARVPGLMPCPENSRRPSWWTARSSSSEKERGLRCSPRRPALRLRRIAQPARQVRKSAFLNSQRSSTPYWRALLVSKFQHLICEVDTDHTPGTAFDKDNTVSSRTASDVQDGWRLEFLQCPHGLMHPFIKASSEELIKPADCTRVHLRKERRRQRHGGQNSELHSWISLFLKYSSKLVNRNDPSKVRTLCETVRRRKF